MTAEQLGAELEAYFGKVGVNNLHSQPTWHQVATSSGGGQPGEVR